MMELEKFILSAYEIASNETNEIPDASIICFYAHMLNPESKFSLTQVTTILKEKGCSYKSLEKSKNLPLKNIW